MTFIDGGLLFYTVVWETGITYGEILGRYIRYVKSDGTFTVFDGYLKSTTKVMTHQTRNPVQSLDIEFDEGTVPDCKREFLLSKLKNKQRFINLPAQSVINSHYHVQLDT